MEELILDMTFKDYKELAVVSLIAGGVCGVLIYYFEEIKKKLYKIFLEIFLYLIILILVLYKLFT